MSLRQLSIFLMAYGEDTRDMHDDPIFPGFVLNVAAFAHSIHIPTFDSSQTVPLLAQRRLSPRRRQPFGLTHGTSHKRAAYPVGH